MLFFDIRGAQLATFEVVIDGDVAVGVDVGGALLS